MGVYGNYCTVDPDVLDAHRDDFARWGELFDPRDYEGRVFTVDRLWDALWFVLDPARREGLPSAPGNILGAAVIGARVLSEEVTRQYEEPEGAVAYKGRYLSPEEVQAAARALEGVTAADVLAVYDPAAMKAAHVYRVGTPEVVLQWLEELRAFYARASADGKAVTVRIS